MTKKKHPIKTALEIGAGLAAAGGAAAAGYYYYGSDKAKKHRTAAKQTLTNLKNAADAELAKLPKETEKKVASIVKRVRSATKNA